MRSTSVDQNNIKTITGQFNADGTAIWGPGANPDLQCTRVVLGEYLVRWRGFRNYPVIGVVGAHGVVCRITSWSRDIVQVNLYSPSPLTSVDAPFLITVQGVVI